MSKDGKNELEELKPDEQSVPMQDINLDGVAEFSKLFRPFEDSPKVISPFELRENRKP